MASRNLVCTDCGALKWVNQYRWKKLSEEFGHISNVRRKFQCVPCRKLKSVNPFEYEMRYGRSVKVLTRELSRVHKRFRKDHNLDALKQSIADLLISQNLPIDERLNLILRDDLFQITINKYPFIEKLILPIYVKRKPTNAKSQ